MEIIYTLVIDVGESIALKYVNKDITEIANEIKDFEDKFGNGPIKCSYKIEVQIEETVDLKKERFKRRYEKHQAARNQTELPKASKGNPGRGKPKGHKLGETFEQTRARLAKKGKDLQTLPPEDY